MRIFLQDLNKLTWREARDLFLSRTKLVVPKKILTKHMKKYVKKRAREGEDETTIGQLAGEIKKSKADRKEVKAALAEANAIRETDAAEYAKSSGEMEANVGAMGQAIGAILSEAKAALARRCPSQPLLPEICCQLIPTFVTGR